MKMRHGRFHLALVAAVATAYSGLLSLSAATVDVRFDEEQWTGLKTVVKVEGAPPKESNVSEQSILRVDSGSMYARGNDPYPDSNPSDNGVRRGVSADGGVGRISFAEPVESVQLDWWSTGNKPVAFVAYGWDGTVISSSGFDPKFSDRPWDAVHQGQVVFYGPQISFVTFQGNLASVRYERPSHSVPEPGTSAALLIASGSLFWWLRRREQQRLEQAV